MRRAYRATEGAGEPEAAEELEFERLFAEGIHYANMVRAPSPLAERILLTHGVVKHLDDLMAISRDVSPSTSKPFVPLTTLQGSLWNQSMLYHKITYRPPGSASPSLAPTNTIKELGIGMVTADVERLATHSEERDKAFYPVPSDASLRLGDSTGIEGASMDQLFDPQSGNGNGKRNGPLAEEANFFGLEQARRPASAFASSSSSSPADSEAKWTAHPPYRFAVEFWDVDALKEKSRLHSHTIWYAGSLYNVYVQVVRKKGVQLGIYLHRQSTVDPIPPSSASTGGILPPPPPHRGHLLTRATSSASIPRPPSAVSAHSHNGSTVPIPHPPLGRTVASTPSTPVSAPGSPPSAASVFSRSSKTLHASTSSVGSTHVASSISLPATAPPVAPPQPYRDPRPAVSAYFTIACASATGASLTRFTSAPDVFSVSQSWGWKSSSLRTEEYLEVDADGQPAPVALPAVREVSLRATVVLGVV